MTRQHWEGDEVMREIIFSHKDIDYGRWANGYLLMSDTCAAYIVYFNKTAYRLIDMSKEYPHNLEIKYLKCRGRGCGEFENS